MTCLHNSGRRHFLFCLFIFLAPCTIAEAMSYVYGFLFCCFGFFFVCFFQQTLMPKTAAFVVLGLIPLSAPASPTHCVSFCSPQEGRTGASVFGLAMSKSALLVLSQEGCTPSLCLTAECLLLLGVEQRVLFCLSSGAALHKALSCVDVDAGSVTAVTLWLSSLGLSV